MTLVSIDKPIIQKNPVSGAAPIQAKSVLGNQAACWRIVVLPPKTPTQNEAQSGAGGLRIRWDRPHAVKAPKLPLHWSSDVGFHQRVADSISTISPEGGAIETFSVKPIRFDAIAPKGEGAIERFDARPVDVGPVDVSPELRSGSRPTAEVVRSIREQNPANIATSADVSGMINSIAVQNRIAAKLQPSVVRKPKPTEAEAKEQSIAPEIFKLPSQVSPGGVEPATERILRKSDDYKKLLTEAAHDIRSPIATASQILHTISNKVRRHGQLSRSEIELLDQANLRLIQANDWAEGILLDRRLEYGRPLPVRKRFYPMQLQSSIRPLLESIASRRSVNLAWNGWERSLPKLYLDANHLSRVMMNLVSNAVDASLKGQSVSINVDWHKTICQPLQISVADQASGISPEIMRQVNSQYTPQGNDGFATRGVGLKTTKALVASMAGTLSAESLSPKGSLLRVSLPIDNPMSLVRSWLTRNTLRVHEQQIKLVPKVFVSIDLVRVGTLDLDFADSQLQLAAFENELPYRVAKDRWLWLAMQSSNRGMPYSLDRTAKRLNELHGPSAEICRVLQVFKTPEFNPEDLQGPNLQTGRMLSIIDSVVTKVAQLIGDNVPATDRLAAIESPIVHQPNSSQLGAFRRIDVRNAPKPNLSLLGSSTQVRASDELTAALKQLAEHWHRTQGKLDKKIAQQTVGAAIDPEFEIRRPHTRSRSSRTPF